MTILVITKNTIFNEYNTREYVINKCYNYFFIFALIVPIFFTLGTIKSYIIFIFEKSIILLMKKRDS